MKFRYQSDTSDPKQIEFLQHYDQVVEAKIKQHFPQFQYWWRMRDWELYQVFSRLPVGNREVRIMDTGVFNTYTALFLEEITDHAVVSDNFAWAQRTRHIAPPVYAPYDYWKNAIQTCAPRVEIKHIDLTDISYPDNTFDYITCISTIEHIRRPRRALEEMVRCVKPGGRVLITTDHSPRQLCLTDCNRYRGLRRLRGLARNSMDLFPSVNLFELFTERQLKVLFQGFTDLAPETPPNYAKENWCYDRTDECILILFVEIVKQTG
jgi:SAM-dependent methyltransferase